MCLLMLHACILSSIFVRDQRYARTNARTNARTQALGMGFAKFAPPVMQRCERIIGASLTTQDEYADEVCGTGLRRLRFRFLVRV